MKKDNYVPNILNRRARHDYHILESLECGIELKGTEVKSIRLGKASLAESYAMVHRDEVKVENMQITPYVHGTHENHDPKRSRKLLLHKKEILKLKQKVGEKGLTLVPLKLYFNARGIAKLELGVAKGKTLFDKRETIKKRDIDRELRRLT